MLHTFASTRPRYVVHPLVLLLSITAHVLFIYVAFGPRAAKSRFASGDVAYVRPVGVERIRYIEVVRPPEQSHVVAQEPAKPKPEPTLSSVPSIHLASIEPIAVGETAPIPDVDFSAKVSAADSNAVPVARVVDLVKGIVGAAPSAVAHDGAYAKTEVDRIVTPFSSNPKPVYPRRFEREGVETSFIAQFVVDSTGHVDEKSVNFPPDVHQLFVDAVRQALRRARFYPAEVGGRRVSQFVEQQFSFVIVQRRGW